MRTLFALTAVAAALLALAGCKQNPVQPSQTVSAMAADSVTTPDSGLTYDYYLGAWTALPAFTPDSSILTYPIASFDISSTMSPSNFAFVFTGYLKAPAEGAYTFYCTSDDGSKLFIGDSCVVDNDGMKNGAVERSGTVSLQQGFHRIRVEYFCAGDSHVLTVAWQGPGFSRQTIGASSLFHEATPYTLLLIAPLGAHTYTLGDTVPIRWFYADSPDNVHETDIELSTDGGKSYMQLFATAKETLPGDTGTVLWIIPADTAYCTDRGLLKVSEYDRSSISAQSDVKFTIRK